MINTPGGLRLVVFGAAATLLAALTIELAIIGVQFFTSPPVRAQVDAWTEGWFAGFSPPPHLVNASRAENPPPFIPVTGGEPPLPVDVAADAALTPTPTPTRDAFSTPAPVEEPLAPQGRLEIPSLGVSQTLQTVPVTNGDWDVSALTDKIGWLETTGAKPHDRYAMAFVGHVTMPRPAGPGPFYRLRELEPGDEIIFRLGDQEFVYQVDERKVVPPEKVELLYIEDGDSIVLVTCSGWNYLAQQYDYRLVVRAGLVRTVRNPGPTE